MSDLYDNAEFPNEEEAVESIIEFNDGQSFLAYRYEAIASGTCIVAVGDWQRHIELIGMPPTTLLIPLTSIKYIRLFDNPATPGVEGENFDLQAENS